MHQQVRVSTKTERSGPGAQAANEGSLLDILGILEEGQVNMRAAGGCRLGRGGTFGFAVEHGEEERARDLLIESGYSDARIVQVHECEVSDEPGQLRQCISDLEAEGQEVDEIFVGTPNENGSIPIQLVTRGADEGASGSF